MHAYLFEMIYDEEGPHVKYGYDVSSCVSPEYTEAITMAKAAKAAAIRLGVSNPPRVRSALNPIIKKYGLTSKLNEVRPAFLRAQITGIPLYLIKTEEPMTFDEIDNYVKALGRQGKLKAFLEKAKVA